MSLSDRLARGLASRCKKTTIRILDQCRESRIRLCGSWPCQKRQILVVGCESSGTTVISRMLHGNRNGRFLVEGHERWVWRAYMSVYRGEAHLSEYPRLQLFDFVKVPGFAAILEKYKAAFPNSSIVYVVRDPRDVLLSAIRTFRVTSFDDLNEVNWIKQDWLGIPERDPVMRLAMRWLAYLREARKVAGVHFLKYEDFFCDRIEVIRQLADMLDIEFDQENAEKIAVTQASHASVRDYEPLGPLSPAAYPFLPGDAMQRIEGICASEMDEFRYSRVSRRQ